MCVCKANFCAIVSMTVSGCGPFDHLACLYKDKTSSIWQTGWFSFKQSQF